jgi:hypothetical protein
MNRKYNINGTVYEYDMDRITVRDAMMLKTATGLNLQPFSTGLSELDPQCLAALAWLVQTKAGVKGPSGEPLKLADVDFDVMEFFVEEPEPEPVDPTPGEDSTSPEDSTLPGPLTTTP